MNNKAFVSLEFDKVKNNLASFAKSISGKEKCFELEPYTNIHKAELELAKTNEAFNIINYIGYNPMQDFDNISEYIVLVEKGGVLNCKALLQVASFLRVVQSVYKNLTSNKNSEGYIHSLACSMLMLPHLEQDISKSILSEDEISDMASSELASIRKKIKIEQAKVKEKLNAFLKNPNLQKYLQENIITIRNDRYVLPVKHEYRSNVQGLVHDQSSSGSTLFIEPISVVNINNEIKQLINQEQAEIRRILIAFSESIRRFSKQLECNTNVLVELDFIFAKASYAKDLNAVKAHLNTDKKIKLKNARHPLIEKNKVVPISIWIGYDFKCLIITGPNTGGKTVTLKTIGLLSLMAQSGLFIPCDEGSEINVYNNIYADIGDEQSIEQSLSTFSAHMKSIVKIVESANENDLVLFDELGAGTDPTEGAALAQAILCYFLDKNISCIATSHYSELKAFAMNTNGVENASAEFDIATLSPTYKISIGLPGKSNAFEISKRLGLNVDIIQRAKDTLSENNIRFEDLIANAQMHSQLANRERELAKQFKDESLSLQQRAYRELESAKKQAQEIINKAKSNAKTIVDTAQIAAEKAISDVKKLKQDASNIKKIAKDLRDRSDSLVVNALDNSENSTLTINDINIGDHVLIISLNKEAQVVSIDKQEVIVQVGAMKMNMPPNKLRKIKPKEQKIHAGFIKRSSNTKVKLELDLRGYNLDEAIVELDNYLHAAILNGYKTVNIIHGKGTGVLKKGIAKHLKTLKHVDSFRLGGYGEGEDGVSIVSLK